MGGNGPGSDWFREDITFLEVGKCKLLCNIQQIDNRGHIDDDCNIQYC